MDDNTPQVSAYRLNGANFRVSVEIVARQLDLDGDGRPRSLTVIPMYFLVSQAAELFLKAALLKRGVPESKLRGHQLRHDLDALVQALKDLNVPVSADAAAGVHGLSEQHRNHQLRYTVLLEDAAKTYCRRSRSLFATLDELVLRTRLSDA